MSTGADRARHLLHQAAGWRGPHAVARRGAARRRGPVHVVALGEPGPASSGRRRVPHTVLPAPPAAGTAGGSRLRLGRRARRRAAPLGDRFDILHTQDCISARAAARVRDAGAPVRGGAHGAPRRRLHHAGSDRLPAAVDPRTRPGARGQRVLADAAARRVRRATRRSCATGSTPPRFAPIPAQRRAALRGRDRCRGPFPLPRRRRYRAAQGHGRPVRGARPAEGHRCPRRRCWRSIGGHSFQDYAPYRDDALARLPELGLDLGRDVVLLGTVPEAELGAWYRAADALAFPSVKEGWGLAVLEAMSADLPVVASDLPVFREYLVARPRRAAHSGRRQPGAGARRCARSQATPACGGGCVPAGGRWCPGSPGRPAPLERRAIYETIRSARAAPAGAGPRRSRRS